MGGREPRRLRGVGAEGMSWLDHGKVPTITALPLDTVKTKELIFGLLALFSLAVRSSALEMVVTHNEHYSDRAHLYSTGLNTFAATHRTSDRASMSVRVYCTPHEMVLIDLPTGPFLSVDGMPLPLKKSYGNGFLFAGDPPFRKLSPAFGGNFSGRRDTQDVSVMFLGTIATVKLRLTESSVTHTVPSVVYADQLPTDVVVENDYVRGIGRVEFPSIRTNLPARPLVVRSSSLRVKFSSPEGMLSVTANGMVIPPESSSLGRWSGVVPLGPGLTTISALDTTFAGGSLPAGVKVIFDGFGGQYWGTVSDPGGGVTASLTAEGAPEGGGAAGGDPVVGQVHLTRRADVDTQMGFVTGGLFTAQVRLFGKRFIFRNGEVGVESLSKNTVGDERARLRVDSADMAGFSGTVTLGGKDYPVQGGRHTNSKANPTPLAGPFTARLTPSDGPFGGHSVMHLFVGKTGSTRIAGRMANDEAFTTSAWVTEDRVCRFQADLKRGGTGSVGGLIDMGPGPAPGVPVADQRVAIAGTGVVRWPGDTVGVDLEIAGAPFDFGPLPIFGSFTQPDGNVFRLDASNEDAVFTWQPTGGAPEQFKLRLSNAYTFSDTFPGGSRGNFYSPVQLSSRKGLVTGQFVGPTSGSSVFKSRKFIGVCLQPIEGDPSASPIRVAGYLVPLNPAEAGASERAEISAVAK